MLLASGPVSSADWSESDVGDGAVCVLGRVNRLEASSRSCLTCHDGSVEGKRIYRNAAGHRGENVHPIEVSYTDRAAFSDRFEPPRRLHPALVLQDGKVTCVTCHDGMSEQPYHTALPMNGSRLCLSCHRV
ncbi:hypothetical protein AMPC_33920 [Anaeromyxobacter paludicola]|uniref:Doubled CXXCH motif domain-containing protein n=1 Tax=Anaeromyxobacter paludicola TaxID=2918171 RepID=A0ABN6NAN3_9BACT|nr:hypothetical protein AMPC_33920 [Anaeromyxobacter paludicola]